MKLKMFPLCLNQVELAVFTLYSLRCIHICILIKKLLNKLNLTFLFSSFRSNIENIDTKMCSHGFQEQMFSIQEQCIFVSVYGFCFDL